MNSLSFFEKITLSKASGSVQWHIKFQPIDAKFSYKWHVVTSWR